jgi:hypothetical protein
MTMQRIDQGGQVAVRGGHVERTEGVVIRDSDLVLPFMNIVQPTSVEGTEGMFRRSDTGEEHKELLVVTLAIQPTRTKFPPGKFSRDSKPECWSDDDLHASSRPRFEDGQEVHAQFAGQACAGCEFNVRFGGSEHREQGMCTPAYVAALFLPESYETVMVRLQSTNTRLVRVLGAAPHVRKAVMRVWLEQQVNDSGKWYALKVSASHLLDDAELDAVNGAYESLRGKLGSGVDEEATPPAFTDPDAAAPFPEAPQPARPAQPVPNIIGKPRQVPAAPQAPAQPQSTTVPMAMPKPGEELPF